VCSRASHSRWARCSRVTQLVMMMALAAVPVMGQIGRSIEGQVSTLDHGLLPSDITVRLEEAEGAYVAQRFVGNDGKFVFDDLKGGLYRIVVTAKGFQTQTQIVDMSWGASRTPRIYLVPVVKKTSPSSASSTEAATDLAAPKKARKEYEKGSRALDSENLEEARKHLENAVAEGPCFARAQTALGLTLSMQHQFAAAESVFKQSIKCDGGFLPAYLQLAILLKAQKRYKECEATLQQGLRVFPSEWQLHYQLAIAKDGSRHYEESEQEFLRAQAINPEVPPEFHLRLASLYLNWKKYDKAHAEMETYLRADPDGRFAEPTRKMMQQMEDSGMVASSKRRTDQTKP